MITLIKPVMRYQVCLGYSYTTERCSCKYCIVKDSDIRNTYVGTGVINLDPVSEFLGSQCLSHSDMREGREQRTSARVKTRMPLRIASRLSILYPGKIAASNVPKSTWVELVKKGRRPSEVVFALDPV